MGPARTRTEVRYLVFGQQYSWLIALALGVAATAKPVTGIIPHRHTGTKQGTPVMTETGAVMFTTYHEFVFSKYSHNSNIKSITNRTVNCVDSLAENKSKH